MPLTSSLDLSCLMEQTVNLANVPSGGHKRVRRLPMPKFDMSTAEIIYQEVEKQGFYIKSSAPPERIGGTELPIQYGDGSITSDIVRRMGATSVDIGSFENFSKLYANKDNVLEYRRISTVIFKKDDKITMTNFDFTRVKKQGRAYSEKIRENTSFTLNFKSGCFYYTKVCTNGNSQTHRSTRKNDFNFIRQRMHCFKDKHVAEFMSYVIKEFGLKNEYTVENTKNIGEYVTDVIIDWFIKVNGLKTTDNFRRTFIDYYPGLTLMKKKKGNLTEAICSKYKFKGKKLRKILNVNDNVNIFKMKFLQSIFDIHQINSIPDETILKFCESPGEKGVKRGRHLFDEVRGNKSYAKIFQEYEEKRGTMLTVSEQHRLIKLLDEGLVMGDVVDHIKMRDQIIEYTGEELRFSFRNKLEFQREHELYSKVLREIKRPTTKVIYYPQETIELIQKPIYLTEEYYNVETGENEETTVEYLPFLLQSKEEYMNEGAYQSHCVGGYAEYADSNIISLRRGAVRLTCEFSRLWGDKQKRMRSNASPDSTWLKAYQLLYNRLHNAHGFGRIVSKELRSIEDINEKIARGKQMLHNLDITDHTNDLGFNPRMGIANRYINEPEPREAYDRINPLEPIDNQIANNAIMDLDLDFDL